MSGPSNIRQIVLLVGQVIWPELYFPKMAQNKAFFSNVPRYRNLFCRMFSNEGQISVFEELSYPREDQLVSATTNEH